MNWDFMVRTFFKTLSGVPTTLLITVATLIFSVPLASVLALARSRKVPVLQRVAAVYVSFIRGTPAIVQIYLVYNTLPSALAILFEKWNIQNRIFDVNPVIYAVVVFTLSIAATMSEIIRSALSTVDKGQMEAALTIGLTEMQGYLRIVIPQALIPAIPNLCTLVVRLIKMTSLAFIMTVQDITAIAKIEAASGYNYIEAYLDIFVIYLILCITIEKLFKILENRLNKYKTATV